MAKGRFHLTLPGELVGEPIIHTLGSDFGVVTTIRRANLEEGSGWVILEMDGTDESVDDAVAWLRERGVTVDRLEEAPGG
ncbi:MAG TPA: NIL domain-containing protein [Actinomycetota bacterium]|nr:NIL domain-containing protein [Actinomycetota bacterium]